MEQKARQLGKPQAQHDYEAIAASAEFQTLVQKKNRFLLPVTVFFLLFYFALPLLTSFSTVLNRPAIGDISWVWVFAGAQFIMTWSLCMLYVRKANQFDEEANSILENEQDVKERERG